MAYIRNNLGRHFIYWYLDELIEQYEKCNVVVHVSSVDFKEPLRSVISLERRELRDA